MAYIFGSIWDRFNRNALNNLSKNVEIQGKSIQDLIAEGQLTPSQYAQLVSIVNGNIKRGDISVYDIDKNKGKLDSTYFSSDFLKDLNNGEIKATELLPASVTNDKVAKKAVDPIQTTFISASDNLIGKEIMVFSQIPDSSGNLIYQNARNTTKHLEISGTISFTGVIEVNEYGASKNFIKKNSYTSSTKNTLTLNSSTRYIRATVTDTYLDTCQLNEGGILLPYDVYTEREFDSNLKFKNGEVKKEELEIIVPEKLFANEESLKHNYMINRSGEIVNDDRYKTTGFERVDSEENYTFKNVQWIALYDKYRNFIETWSLDDGLEYTRSFIDTVEYIRISVLTEKEDGFKMNKGTVISDSNNVVKSHINPKFLDISPNNVEEDTGPGKFFNHQNEIYKTIVKSQPRNFLPQPMLVMTYDDNPVTDYTKMFPVHQAHNVPGEIATISGFLKGEVPAAHPQPSMSIEQLMEMQDFGFEISTHSYSHLNLGGRSLQRNTMKGSNKWHVGDHSSWNRRYPYEAMVYHRLGDENFELVKIIGEEYDAAEDRVAYISEKPAKFNHNELTSSIFSLSENELYREIVKSNQELNNLGFNSSSIAYPYNSNHWHTRKIVAEHLSSGRAGNPEKIGVDMDGTNSFLPTYQLKSYAEITSWSETEINTLLQEIKDNNSLGMVFEHTWRSGFSPSGLDYIFNKCKQLGIKVTTRKEALKHHGNRFEYGDYMRDKEPYVNAEPNMIINASGKVFENIVNQ